MENRHSNCKENSSERPSRNPPKKCYSLPLLQKENEKLKNDWIALKGAHDEKEMLLTETLRKVELLEEENHEMKMLLNEADNNENVKTKEASLSVSIETPNASQATSEITDTTVYMKDASTYAKVATKDVSTCVRIATRDSATQVEVETICGSIPSSADMDNENQVENEANHSNSPFNGPYDEKSKLIIFEKNLTDQKLSSNLKQNFQKIGGANISKLVNNILNSIATKDVLKTFVWDYVAPNSFQSLKNILACIHSVVCSKENTQEKVNNIKKNALKNARAK